MEDRPPKYFSDFNYEKKEYVFVRTEQQIDKIISGCSKIENVIILYTIVETKLAKYISQKCSESKTPCFGILGNLILEFSKRGVKVGFQFVYA